ncbi:MAG: tetratricopeptide repeat protein [Elusimicrobia bacterium]|nr:tetratricopeptide repeat protein [Elusimicrobiota bacterium]
MNNDEKSNNINHEISKYHKALQIDPDNIEALIKLGQTYETKGDTEKEPSFYVLAQESYEKAIAKKPSDFKIHNLIITLSVKQGRSNELLKQYEKKLHENPNDQTIAKSVKILTAISLASIPPRTSYIKPKGEYSKIVLDYILPYAGIGCAVLGFTVPALRAVGMLGIFILALYIMYKLLFILKSAKNKYKRGN